MVPYPIMIKVWKKIAAAGLTLAFILAGACSNEPVEADADAIDLGQVAEYLEKAEEYREEQESAATESPTPQETEAVWEYELPDEWFASYDSGGVIVNIGAEPQIAADTDLRPLKMEYRKFARGDIDTVEKLFAAGGLCTIEAKATEPQVVEDIFYEPGSSGMEEYGVRIIANARISLSQHGGAKVEISNADTNPHLLYVSDSGYEVKDKGISAKEAEKIAQATAEAMGAPYLKPDYIYYGYSQDGEPLYYGVELRRVEDGINTVKQLDDIEYDEKGGRWRTELMTLHINGNGVIYMSWSGRMNTSGKIALEQEELLDFKSVEGIFADSSGEAISNSAAALTGAASPPFSVNIARLEYMHVREPEQTGVKLTPVWAFYNDHGSVAAYSAGHFALMTIDAFSGELRYGLRGY